MASKTVPLEYDRFYHIYNRGINGCRLFFETGNYEYFLYLYNKYISPVAETFAWVLKRNHFHFLVRIKKEEEIPFMDQTPEGRKDASGSVKNLSVFYRTESVLKKNFN
jgi:REP-associated tyrosine transposase